MKYLYLPQKVKNGENDNVSKISLDLKIFLEEKGKRDFFSPIKHTSTVPTDLNNLILLFSGNIRYFYRGLNICC